MEAAVSSPLRGAGNCLNQTLPRIVEACPGDKSPGRCPGLSDRTPSVCLYQQVEDAV